MKEQFVTYEIALKLKELGFDGQCLAVYNLDQEFVYGLSIKDIEYIHKYTMEDESILAPLWQQAVE